MTRGNARELAVHLIYGRDFTGDEPETAVALRLDKEYYAKLSAENEIYADRPSRKQLQYIDSVVAGVANREEELNSHIQQYSIGWNVSRISRLTRAVLQLALFEMEQMDEIPTKIAINEAVELAKRFDEEGSRRFVNGILGALAER